MKLFLNKELLAEEPHHSQLRAALARLAEDETAIITLSESGQDRLQAYLQAYWDPHIGICLAYRESTLGPLYEDNVPFLSFRLASLVLSSYARRTNGWRTMVRWHVKEAGLSKKRILRRVILLSRRAYFLLIGLLLILPVLIPAYPGWFDAITVTAAGIGASCLTLGLMQVAAEAVEYVYRRDIREDSEDSGEGIWVGVMMACAGALVLLAALFP